MPGTPSASGNELLALGAQYPCVRDSLLACGAVFLSTGSQPVPRHAVVYYSDAVHSTRKMIEESRLDGTEDWLFVQTLLLCIFEASAQTPTGLVYRVGLTDGHGSVHNQDHPAEPCPIC